MKTTTIVLAGVAVFAGAFGALRANEYLTHRIASAPLAFNTTASVRPVVYAPEAGGTAAAPFDFTAASKKVTPSVVSIDQYKTMAQQDFMGNTGPAVEREVGQGSGVILTADGYIVTNNHVVQGGSRFVVHLSDGRTLDAKVVGQPDSRSDLAVIKVEAKDLVAIETAPIESVQVGQWVLAVGNPLGFSNTVSVGVVSSLKRDLPVGEAGLVNAIQTDAAINPGNSGGALCDAQGRLIGINSAIASGNGGSVGLGFSIPIDRVQQVVQDIKNFGYAKYAGLGISLFRYDLANPGVRQELAQRTNAENVPEAGIIVESAPGSAGQAGLKTYDVVIGIDGTKIGSYFDVNKALVTKKPGDQVTVKFWSKGQEKTAKIVLQDLQPQRRM